MAAANNNTNSPPNTTATNTTPRTSSPPWTQIVRGPETEPKPEPQPEAEQPVSPTENVEKPPAVAWSKRPMSTGESSSGNGSVGAAGGGGGGGGGESGGGGAVVMGAERWPSLSECTTKVSPKVIGNEPSPSMTVLSPVRSPSSPFQKTATSNSNHQSNSNHARPARQKSMKRDGGSSSQANGVLSHQSSQAAGEGAHHHHNHGSPRPVSNENSVRDNVQTHNHRESGQRNAGGDHPHQRNPFRRGNGGSHSRGEGSHQNYGGRRNDQERGNHDLNHQRSFNGRDASMQPRGAPRSFVRTPPPVSASFVFAPPPPMPPFINSLMPLYLAPGVQFGPPPPIYFPAPSPELYSELLKQINYYFSNDNLVRDTFLRGKMDEQGWVSIDIIAEFNRVKCLTNDPYQILEAVRPSTVVEVQGDRIRRRDDWSVWLLPPTVQFPTSPGLQSPNLPAVSSVTDHIQSVSLDASGSSSQASSRDSNSESKKSVDEASPSGC